MEASQMLGFLCFRFLLRLALLYFYAGDLSASMEKILLDSVLWLKLQTISGIQSSSVDVQGVKAFRVQNRARSLYRWRRTYPAHVRIACGTLREPNFEPSPGKEPEQIFHLSTTALDGLC